jgi:hypothetical protein
VFGLGLDVGDRLDLGFDLTWSYLVWKAEMDLSCAYFLGEMRWVSYVAYLFGRQITRYF